MQLAGDAHHPVPVLGHDDELGHPARVERVVPALPDGQLDAEDVGHVEGPGDRVLPVHRAGVVVRPGRRVVPGVQTGHVPRLSGDAGLEAGIPAQPWHVAGLYAGHDSAPGPDHDPRPVDWQDPIAGALDVADVLGVELTVRQGRHHAFHPGRVAELVVVTEHGDRVVGVAGELHPQWLEAEDLPARTSVWELDLDALCAAAPEIVVAAPLSTFPVSTQDVALVVDEAVVAGDVRATLAEGAGELLEACLLYTSPSPRD